MKNLDELGWFGVQHRNPVYSQVIPNLWDIPTVKSMPRRSDSKARPFLEKERVLSVPSSFCGQQGRHQDGGRAQRSRQLVAFGGHVCLKIGDDRMMTSNDLHTFKTNRMCRHFIPTRCRRPPIWWIFVAPDGQVKSNPKIEASEASYFFCGFQVSPPSGWLVASGHGAGLLQITVQGTLAMFRPNQLSKLWLVRELISGFWWSIALILDL